MAGRMRVWARGVDRELFDPARRDTAWRRAQGFADTDTVVVFFGRLVLEKGIAVFAEAMNRVRVQRPDAKVLVIGDGPARAWMQERMPYAVFTGSLVDEALARAVASGDILLNPSNTETFGNVTLEAMASGLAVVGADAIYHHALLDPGRTGLMCPPADAEAYAAAVLTLVGDPLRRRAMGLAARAASSAYQWSQILSGVAEVYREAMGARSRPAAA